MNCADCKFWVPTYAEVYRPGTHPHEARQNAAESEMLRATHALCSWPAASKGASSFIAGSPDWFQKRVSGGTLTSEDDGADCAAWQGRDPIDGQSHSLPCHPTELDYGDAKYPERKLCDGCDGHDCKDDCEYPMTDPFQHQMS